MQMARDTDSEVRALKSKQKQLSKELAIPLDALPGSLALTHRRCGKPNCHCADGQGHPQWSLTFMDAGKKRVERIPDDWVERVRERVEMGRGFKRALAELWAANAKLLALSRRKRRR